jgi:acyl-CoA thioesterase
MMVRFPGCLAGLGLRGLGFGVQPFCSSLTCACCGLGICESAFLSYDHGVLFLRKLGFDDWIFSSLRCAWRSGATEVGV